jgi:capsid protein
MNILDRIRRFFSPAADAPRQLRARYDIAQTTSDNAAHWAMADGSDSDRANSPGVRQLARNRSRYETDNNPSLKGIVRTITHYEIGTGPTLHVDHDDEEYSDDVERRWSEWCEAVNLPGKLRQMVYGRVVDGEAFARIGENPSVRDAVKLDFQPFECDRVYTLWLPYLTPYRIDGIWFDTWGNPTYYDVLQYHPGGVFPMPTWKFDTIPAQYILHLFTAERANQHRGMPEMSSSTDLFADRRRFRKATIASAEAAANVAGFLTTNQPADDGSDVPEAGTAASMPRNSLVVAPDGYDMKQITAEHPAQTYEMFAAETLNEAARPVSMALNVAKCDSSRYNFAGGRLDIITSWKAVETNQSNNTWRVVNPLFRAWYVEARITGKTPTGRRWSEIDGGQIPPRQFYWVGMPYSDPEAEQTADAEAVTTGLKGIQEVYARRGRDWKVQQKLNAKSLGMSVDEYLEWVKSNLTRNKGGMPGAEGGEEKPPKEKPDDTPETVAAKWRAYHAKTLARMNGNGNGHLRAEAADGQWITINGAHILVKDGQSKEDAINEHTGKGGNESGAGEHAADKASAKAKAAAEKASEVTQNPHATPAERATAYRDAQKAHKEAQKEHEKHDGDKHKVAAANHRKDASRYGKSAKHWEALA